MKTLGPVVVWVAGFLLMVSPVAAQKEIACEKTVIEYSKASSQAKCFYGAWGAAHAIIHFNLLIDVGTRIVVLNLRGRTLGWSARQDLRKTIEAYDKDVKESGDNWSNDLSIKTGVGRVHYRTFSLNDVSCFAFTRRKYNAYIIIVWQCHFNYGDGTNITPAMVRDLVEAALIRD